MSQVSDQDVAAIKQWLSKQSHLPDHFDDLQLKKFLFSCYWSLEQTKQCLEKLCRYRQSMTETFVDRDPTSTAMKNAFQIARIAMYTSGNTEIHIHKLVDTTDYVFYDTLKTLSLQADRWLLRKVDPLPERHVFILDIQIYTLWLVTKVNILYFQKFLIFLLESMPVRLAEIHLVNCPSFYEYLYNLVKSALPPEVRKLIKFHPGYETLHEYIDKKSLPKDYGGDAESIQENHEAGVKEIQDNREFYLNDSLWKATGPVVDTATFEKTLLPTALSKHLV